MATNGRNSVSSRFNGLADAEPLPHGRRQLFAILDPAVRRDRRRVGVRPEQPAARRAGTGVSLRIMTASGTQVDVKLGASADGIAVDIGVSEGELSEDERLAIAGLAKSFQDAVDGLGSVPPRLAVAGLAKFDSSCWPRCRWKPPSPPEIRAWPRSASRPTPRSVPDDQERHRRGHGECGRQPAHGGRQRPAARRRGRQLSAEVRRRPQPWRRRPDPDVLLQGSVLGPAPELRDGRAVAAEPHRQEQGRGAPGASRRAVGHGGLLGLDHAGPGGEQSLPDGRAGRLLLPGHAAHQHQRCAEPGRECVAGKRDQPGRQPSRCRA